MFKVDSKEKTPKYVYEKLSTLMKEQDIPKENVYCYGIISDCTNISKNQYQLTQITLQLVDDTSNVFTTDRLISAIITANDDTIPYFIRLGDIIRIHRGKLSAYNEIRKIHLNKGGHWAIFSGEISEDFVPISKSSKNITFEDHDKPLIIILRHFAKGYFQKENVYKLHSYQNLSVKPKDELTKQCLLLIKEKKAIGDMIFFKVCDSKNYFEMKLDRNKYDEISKDDVIILKFVKTDKEQIVLNANSIILVVPVCFHLFSHFKTTIEEFQENEIIIDAKDIDLIISQSQQIEEKSEVELFREEFQKLIEQKKIYFIKCKKPEIVKINLNQIQDTKICSYSAFNTDLMVIAISPKDEREFVKVYCRDCNLFFSTKEYSNVSDNTEGFVCMNNNCRNNCILIYHVILHCVSEYNSIKVFNFILSTYDDYNDHNKGINFFRQIPPRDLYKNPDILTEIKKFKSDITSFLTFININCELIKASDQTNKTKILFRVIGEY